MFNTQGLTGRVFMTGFLTTLIPVFIILYGVDAWGFYPTIAILSGIGLVGILFKNPILNYISRLYKRRKYQTLQGFKQE